MSWRSAVTKYYKRIIPDLTRPLQPYLVFFSAVDSHVKFTSVVSFDHKSVISSLSRYKVSAGPNVVVVCISSYLTLV